MSNFSSHANLIYAWTMSQEHRHIGDDWLLIWWSAWHIWRKKNREFSHINRMLRRTCCSWGASLSLHVRLKIEDTIKLEKDLCLQFLARSTFKLVCNGTNASNLLLRLVDGWYHYTMVGFNYLSEEWLHCVGEDAESVCVWKTDQNEMLAITIQ